jgi:hypothetical protein
MTSLRAARVALLAKAVRRMLHVPKFFRLSMLLTIRRRSFIAACFGHSLIKSEFHRQVTLHWSHSAKYKLT